ncbi:MAG TPA: Ig-like domain-containing protein, partial [Microbacteriaceae bacterium]|nr:Ig-like domain-containing protein [Microbacteriaceae bacterium]
MSARKNKTFKNITLVATIFGMVLLGVYWPGFDAYEQPPLNASVWALQTGEGKKFARVNTELAELDTVKDATNPTAIFQHGDSTYLFANGNQNFTEINPATPQDLVGDAGNLFKASPPDTIDVKQDGEWIAYLSSKGAVYAGNLGEEPKKLELENAFEANAFALNTNGLVALYSHSESRVVVFDLNNKSVKSDSFLEPKPESNTLEEKVQVTLVADKWLLLNEATKTLIFEGENEKTVLETAQKPLLQRSAQNGSGVFIADELGLLKFDIKTQTITREVLLDNTSEPARPFSLDGTAYAAWVSESNGKLWSSKNSDLKTLDFNGLTLEQDKRLTFQTNGTRAILNEQRSGWVWNIPNGELIRSSQYWNFDDKPPVIIEQAQQQEVKAPKPPVAEADFFGVRAGRSVMLPVLLNDHDPNEDILVIAEDSVSGLNPDFGRVSLSNNAQLLVADISPSAQGSATFTYQISDGTSKDGLLSEPTTVTLNVVAENQNEAPRWCGVESCLSQWPRLKVQAGRSASVEVLDAWVDPDGDPLYVSEYNKETESGRVIVTSEGKVTFQHNDPTTAEQQSLSVPIEVFDTRGLSQSKTLNIDILPQPELTVAPFTVVGIPGQKINVDIAEHVSGASGEVRLRAANLTDDRLGVVSTQTESSVVGFLSQESGSYNLQVLVADEVSETTAQVRVELFDPQQAEITTTPLTAFIRPNEDVTVDVFDGIFDPADSVLMIEEIEIQPEANSILEAQIVGQKHVRATGVTEDGMTGVLGHAKYSVSDGSDLPGRSATGEITFVLLPQGDAAAPIAVDDSVTVNPGTQIDIPVLENDIAPTGTQIQVDPASIVNEHEAGLAFANSRQIRYLAPEKPGEYTVAYSIFRLGHPSQTDTAKVRITVVDDDTDLQFEAPDLEGRVYSGSSVSIPLSATASPFIAGQLNITRIIDQPSKGSASVNSEADKIVYVSESDFSGQVSFRYEASDERGNLISGNVKVGVLDAEADPRPVTYSDYFQAQVGEKNAVSVFPLANDIDPTNTGLSLLSVVPNEPKDSNEYLTLQNKIDSLDLESGLVKIKAGEDLGTFSYVYTAENGFGDTAKGLIIIKVVREPVLGYPQVQDTKLTSETLDTLHSGVDVITDKIVWHSGDPDTLEVVLWGQNDNFETAGKLIKGLPAEKNQIVPFSVGGESYSGEEVVSYGFLRVPSSVANIVSLRSSFTELSVDERGTLEIDMADAVHIPDGESLEVLN